MSDPPKLMGLYADLLADPTKKSSDGTISSAPVKYNLKAQVEASEPALKKKDASLQFQPIRRPQPKGKAKPRVVPNQWPTAEASTAVPATAPAETESTKPQSSSIEYWLGKGNDHNYVKPKPKWYKDKKNKKNKHQETYTPNWDAVYDPSQPNEFRAYKGSEEQHREITDWKNRLYRHVNRNASKKSSDSRPQLAANPMFAPPPITSTDTDIPTTMQSSIGTPVAVPGEDAFARRAQLSAVSNNTSPSTQPAHSLIGRGTTFEDRVAQMALMKAKIDASLKLAAATRGLGDASSTSANLASSPSQAVTTTSIGLGAAISRSDHANETDSVPPPPSSPPPSPPPSLRPSPPPITTGLGATISRAPVRYDAVDNSDLPQSNALHNQPFEDSAPSRSRKEGFGRRMLEKQGWKQGQGLGAKSEGITTAITVQAEKRKKRADAEGGGWQQRANMGKIVGGKRRKIEGQDDEPQMSSVVKIPGMLRGLDVKVEIEEKNLQQELGDWFDKNYGKVERVKIWRADDGGNDEVFIKFTNAISALKAVNPVSTLSFADNDIQAGFFDGTKFDNGEYD